MSQKTFWNRKINMVARWKNFIIKNILWRNLYFLGGICFVPKSQYCCSGLSLLLINPFLARVLIFFHYISWGKSKNSHKHDQRFRIFFVCLKLYHYINPLGTRSHLNTCHLIQNIGPLIFGMLTLLKGRSSVLSTS